MDTRWVPFLVTGIIFHVGARRPDIFSGSVMQLMPAHICGKSGVHLQRRAGKNRHELSRTRHVRIAVHVSETPVPSPDVTTLLKAWRLGDQRALDRLTPLVYDHLRRLAQNYVRREQAATRLDATALVHEAYVKLIDAQSVNWQDRAHFFAVSARIMRRILVDAARTRMAFKRGGHQQRVDHSSIADLDSIPAPGTDRAAELVALDDALIVLGRMDPRRVQVVELRFFAGLSVEETAEALGVSPQTVMRDWKLARAWLARELRRHPEDR
jgi:RNA polymerase sigma factor (TIGR02999 family)